MKINRSIKTYVVTILLSCISIILLPGCKVGDQKTTSYKNILEFADNIKVIDTHEHQRQPKDFGLDTIEFNFYHLLHATYLMQDVISAGGTRLGLDSLGALEVNDGWGMYGDLLNYTRSTSYYGHFVMSFQKLYDFKDLYFTEVNILELSKQIKKNYADYPSWFNVSFEKAGFELMFQDRFWNSLELSSDKHFVQLFHINQLVLQVSKRDALIDDPNSIYTKALEDGFMINTFDDYLEYCDYLFKKNVENRAVCVKNSLAYSRTLDYAEVSFEEADKLFAMPSASISWDEEIPLQDYMFHWIIKKSVEYDLPIQIHTGHLAGDGNYLENSNPLKLNNLFIKYPKAKFILFHGGYPWTSEFIAMGKMFPNVYLDLVWLPQISREKAVLALDEMLDCVPYNKIFWGGDCAFIEEATGSLEFGKSVVAETLTKRIERGLLTEDVAFEIIRRIFRENAVEVFKLEEKLEREF